MVKTAWLTDIHLDADTSPQRLDFYETLAQAETDVFFISGDIANSMLVEPCLVDLAQAVQRPVYFVLGNHDYYGSSIAKVREKMADIRQQSAWLTYLSQTGPQKLTEQTALVGHDGWGDARLGNYETSGVLLNDYRLIEELSYLDFDTRRERLNALGSEAAQHVQQVLTEALQMAPNVVLVTHVPPFREACWYEGILSDDNWAPHFSCGAVGRVLLQQMQNHPQANLLVLCGHTHGSGTAEILPNLQVLTGGAKYGHPVIQRIWEVA